jgi:hemoglobin/transferrin/lactoferrin receptor protein
MRLTSTMAVALMASTMLSAPVLAQDTMAAKSFARLNPIPVVVVTPTKSSRDIDHVPFAVSVVKHEDTQRKQAQSFDDALKDIPNFDSAGGSRRISEEPSLRGLSDRRMVIKVDGIRRNFRAQYAGRYFIDPYLVDRIEVVRGSNSAIEGSGAIAGTIQLFTANALDKLRGMTKNWGVDLTTGFQSNSHELSTSAATYQAHGPVDILVAGSYRSAGDYKDGNGQEVDYSSSEPKNALIKAGYSFSPKHRVEMRVSRFYDFSEVPASPFQPLGTTNRETERETGVTDYSLNYRLAPEIDGMENLFDITSTLYRSEYSITSRRLNILRLDQTYFNTNGIDTYNTASVNAFGLNHKITTGIEYFENEQTGLRNGTPRTTLGDGSDKNFGVYAQEEVMLWDRLTLIPGIRYDHYRLEPDSAALDSQTRDKWSPKIGADLRLNDDWSVYGSWSTAFRTPTLTELYSEGASPGVTIVANPNLTPETAVNKEIGLRYRHAGLLTTHDAVRINLTAFQNDIADYIEQVVEAGPTASFRNVADARLRGVELEANYRIQNTSFTVSAGGVRGDNLTSGSNLSDVPADKVSFSADQYLVRYPVMVGARMNHYADQNKIPTGQPDIVPTESATTYDIYASWTPDPTKDGAMRVDAGVDNLFDKDYRRHLAFIPEEGRNAKVTINWKF